MSRTLIDSNIFIGYAAPSDKYHVRAKTTIERLLLSRDGIVAAPVLSEVFGLIVARTYYRRAVEVDKIIREHFHIEPLTDSDMARMSALMSTYADMQLDYVDAAIVAVAERLNIARIATFDRRDFAVIRPNHIETLELLP